MSRSIIPTALGLALTIALGTGLPRAEAQSKAPIKAKTEDGRDVILNADGTWSFVEASTKNAMKAGSRDFKKAAGSVMQYKGKRGMFAMSLVPGSWKQSEQPNNPDAEVEFVYKEGDAYGMIIAERISIPVESLKKIALDKMRTLDKKAKLVLDEKRMVNGKEVHARIVTAETEGVPITLYAYYSCGPQGSIQVVCFTGQNLFDEMKPELEKFLNGFEILDKK